MAKKKKKSDKTVRFEMHKPFVPPSEGVYYELLVWKFPDVNLFLSLPDAERWHLVESASNIEDLAEGYDKQRQVYTKVQIRKVERKAVLGGE